MGLGQKLRDLRTSKNYSLRDMEDMVGKHYTVIGKYELDQTMPTIATLLKYVEIFGCSLDNLFS